MAAWLISFGSGNDFKLKVLDPLAQELHLLVNVPVLALHALAGERLAMNVTNERAIGDGLPDELLILMSAEHHPGSAARELHLVDLKVDLLLH